MNHCPNVPRIAFLITRSLFLSQLLLCASPTFAAELIPAARIFASTDQGKSWTVSDRGFPSAGTVNDFATHRGTTLAGTENHGAFLSTNRGQFWFPLSNSLPSNLKINATAFLDGAWFLGTHQHGVYKSASLTNWSLANSGLSNQTIRRFAVADNNLYAATDAGLFLSTNSARWWQHLHGASQVTGIAIHKSILYYSDVQGILRSADGGKTFQRVNTDGTPHNLASTATHLFATFYGVGVKKSEDGHIWIASSKGLPTGPQYTFQIRPIGDLLFAAQWQGIYLSQDGGSSWAPSSIGLPSDAITDIIPLDDHTILAAAGLKD